MMTYSNAGKKNHTLTPETYLEQFISGDTRIFIDTCSMLESSFPLFMQNVIPLLEKHKKRIYVPVVVNRELVKHMDNSAKPELAARAVTALKIVNKYKDSYLRILGTEDDPFPDNLFQSLYIRFRQDYPMLFITQDNGLAADILNNNNCNSVCAHSATVKRITPDGYLNNLKIMRENGRWVAPLKKSVSVRNVFTQQSKGAFRICTQLTDIQDDVQPLTEVPGTMDIVYATNLRTGQNAEIELGELIGSGGEGSVYKTNTKYTAKIYKEDKLTLRRKEKVMLMAKKDLEYEGICFPILPLYNSHSEFVGYLMKTASGEELRTSIFCPIPVFMKKHPDWKKTELVQICITILKKIEYLHSKNIILGDINPGNILVKSPTEVYFVDTDSYQIENLPCPVGQCNYTAPEIQGKEYNSYLRTMGNENYAIATLLFQILLLGKLPYAHAGGGEQDRNIIEMNFPYRLGELSNKNEPDGQWRFIWSHLNYAVKEAFYNTFQKGGTYAQESRRLSASQWVDILERYLFSLKEGVLQEKDPMADSLFPTRPKAGEDALWDKCRNCGEPFPYYNQKEHRKLCPACRRKIRSWHVCADCGEEFPLYIGDYYFYVDNKYDLPKRCPSCREIKKRSEAEKYKKTTQVREQTPVRVKASEPIIWPEPIKPAPEKESTFKRLRKFLRGA